LLFFELEFNKLPTSKQKSLIEFCKDYGYYLQTLKEFKKYQLSQKEESILIKKDNTSRGGFSRFFDEYISKITFKLDGKKLSEEEVLSRLYDTNRDIRKKPHCLFPEA